MAPSQLEHSHEHAEIAARIAAPNSHGHLRDAIYGAIDGAVTTFAVVTGVFGGGFSPSVIIILGVANLIGDGFSMAAGNYLGTRAENQQLDRLRAIEEKHIRECPDGEREEIRQILIQQGFDGDLLDQAVDRLTSDQETWVNTMIQHEYGLSTTAPNPMAAAVTTFCSFIVIGFIPLMPFVVDWVMHGPSDGQAHAGPFALSALLTALAFFFVGAVKSRFVQQRWWLAGAETLLVGGTAAVLAYLCAHALASVAS